MDQLPIFVNVRGRKVILVGEGDAADAKRRLIERAGGISVDADDKEAVLAFVAVEDEIEALAGAAELKARGLLVNVVDRPEHCDFTTPALVDRAPVLVAIGTGGASAGMAKAIRQRIETLLPENLGMLAKSVSNARDAIRAQWPQAADRRRALDQAFAAGGSLDPFKSHSASAIDTWLDTGDADQPSRLVEISLLSGNADDLTLLTARLLGEADHIFHDAHVPAAILNRARADAVRHEGAPQAPVPEGLVLYLRLLESG
ncbi:MAG: NAD(P)-dependent oxidoreductase [Sphingorhabdus sp.]|uniref:precorrin-2 dehydrogenase/sirohydrochlorin ferrochelatase family protein n=1 Tax=Sphingorhabdus sp. TaxID=1902408 RepID=UPI0038FD31D4